MFREVQHFLNHFRELEKKQFTQTKEEERQWIDLKNKLTVTGSHTAASAEQTFRRVIAVCSLFPQAGASFLAANYAFCQASRGVYTTLCEHPERISYYYFALDGERRGKASPSAASNQIEKSVELKDGLLRVKMKPPYAQNESMGQAEIASWYLANSKESALLIIDLSSNWHTEVAALIAEWADELWFVLDTDLPRITCLIATEEIPPLWKKYSDKIHLIANKWNAGLDRSSVVKRLEGTLSLWTGSKQSRISAFIPLIDPVKVSTVQSSGKLLLEQFPGCSESFQPLLVLE
ncbi:hypothetical protein [Brevibacillus massiliensis]|uniref:hypothetical protein n=1 Tax=Brevibacillus massiliensis TaxID=1118054 RepID=UPI00031D43B5|nr:hypothetical protein [Brevibacillus massiliensis]